MGHNRRVTLIEACTIDKIRRLITRPFSWSTAAVEGRRSVKFLKRQKLFTSKRETTQEWSGCTCPDLRLSTGHGFYCVL